VSAVDGLERRFAVRKLPGFPLYVSSSVETREIVGGWARQMATYLAIAIPAIALISFFIVLTARRTSAFYAEVERRESLEQEMRHSQRMEAIGQLTGGIAHDFNSLLTVIIGNLQIAMRRVADEKPRAQLEAAQRGAQRAAELTKRLLAFSRNQALDPKPIDVNRLVADMSDLLGRTLGETIAIETVQGGGLWEAEADITELESALLNLAVNARDAMPDGGKLTLETANAHLDDTYCASVSGLKAGQYVMLSITDAGTGMPKEVLHKAFDPFFTTKAPGAGTGLGLSQVYGFVKQSGGHINLYSEPGEGTAVKIYLPRRMGPAQQRAGALSTEPLPRGKGQRILISEDDVDVRDYIAQTLHELGYSVVQATNGQLPSIS
jgi:signal transduction histidine kinase